MSINYDDPQRAQRALGSAFDKALRENASLRIQIEAKDLLLNEQMAEIARLSAKLEEAGIAVEDEPPAEPPKPNRAARRKTAAKGK